MNRDDIIKGALRKCGAIGEGETPSAETISDCAIALNIVAKEAAINGLPLWCVEDVLVPMVAGQAEYNLSVASNSTLPIRVLDCFKRDSQGNDVSIEITSRYDYDTLGQKSNQSVVNQIWYNPQLGNGIVTVYNPPSQVGDVLHIIIQRQIQDFNLATDNPDFPQEAYRMLVWILADEIALEYQCPADVRKEINAKATIYKEKFFDFEQEQASIYFTPSERMRY